MRFCSANTALLQESIGVRMLWRCSRCLSHSKGWVCSRNIHSKVVQSDQIDLITAAGIARAPMSDRARVRWSLIIWHAHFTRLGKSTRVPTIAMSTTRRPNWLLPAESLTDWRNCRFCLSDDINLSYHQFVTALSILRNQTTTHWEAILTTFSHLTPSVVASRSSV